MELDYLFGVSIDALWKDRNELVFNMLSKLRESWLFHIAIQVQMIIDT
jgi:hypothetical protein